MALRRKYTIDQLGDAISDLRAYALQFEGRTDEIAKRLSERGAVIAREEAPADTGELRASIFAQHERRSGQVIASSPHAAFVEFGTGIVGSRNPHPTLPWDYDVNGHGEAGWWYPKDGEWKWTAGQPAKAYMLKTARRLSDEAGEIAKEVLRDD